MTGARAGADRQRAFASIDRRRVGVGLAALAAVAIAAGVAALLQRPSSDPAPEPLHTPGTLTRPDPAHLEADGFVSAGQILGTELDFRVVNVVERHDIRGLFTVLEAPNAAHLTNDDLWMRITGNSGVEVRTLRAVDGTMLRISFARPVDESAHPGTWLVWAENVVTGEAHRVTVTAGGVAMLDPVPLPAGRVYDWRTGVEVDTDGATQLGALDLSLRGPATICDGQCRVEYRTIARPLLAPIAGTFECASGTVAVLTVGSVTLRFTWSEGTPRDKRGVDCTARSVAAGEAIGRGGAYSITALAADGAALSVGAAPDGHLYAGDFAPKVGCPCRHGN